MSYLVIDTPTQTTEQSYCYIMLPLDWPDVHLLADSGDIDPTELAQHLIRIAEGCPSRLLGASGRCFSSVAAWFGTQRHEEVGYACDGCGFINRRMRMCGHCRFTRYCSPMCQRACWREHREVCCGIARVYDRRRRRYRLNYYGYISAHTFDSWRTMLGS